jgi:eukaryotic-like serine/threonine-protein kinase
MPLAPGTRLGPYEITAQIGMGGMGEVYRATDTNLKRFVAIKVLPDSVAGDAERLARFQREAEVLASLNHPNIAAIYGLERTDTKTALVMELVEGPTLADRIAQGPIPVDEGLVIAKQLAEGLEAAHEQGIIHRDLKPANIKIRLDGTVKVLDFGLAKLTHTADAGGPQGDVSQSPTITSPAVTTGVGVLLGTAAYMSPEQAKGRPADKRSDVWAFGCVLYEMVTRRRAFEGEDVSETLASILKSEPDWTLLPAHMPPAIRLLVRRCLARDVKARVPDISVARFVMAELPDAEGVSVASIRTTARASRTLHRVMAGGIVLIAAGAFVTWNQMLRSEPVGVTRLTIQRPGTALIGSTSAAPDVAISSDGHHVAYVAGSDENELFVQPLTQLEPLTFENVGNPVGPFFSPDGRWIGFFDRSISSLRRAAISGGASNTITRYAPFPTGGASWGDDGNIVFATFDTATGLMRVTAEGGTPEVLTTPDPAKGEADHRFPDVLPGARGVLFTMVLADIANGENVRVAVLDLRTGSYRVLITGAFPKYVRSGHLLYIRRDTLYATGFDLDRLELVGHPVPVVERIATKPSGAASFSVASNGTLAYLTGNATFGGQRSLAWIDRQGREEPVAGAPLRTYQYPRLSPAGDRIALDIRDQENDAWIWDIRRQIPKRLTFDAGFNRGVVWSPDGKRIAFSAQRAGTENIYWQASDGTGNAERLTEGTRPQMPTAFSRDERFLVFTEPDSSPFDIHVLDLVTRKTQGLLTSPVHSEGFGEISPDGRWLAYQSDESGRTEIYVRPFPNVDGGFFPISTGGGTRPSWSRDGKELFYYVPPGRIMTVPITTSPTFSAAAPIEAVRGSFFAPAPGRNYDVSPDGKRFVVIKDALQTTAGASRLVIVQNWLDELKRLVPTK